MIFKEQRNVLTKNYSEFRILILFLKFVLYKKKVIIIKSVIIIVKFLYNLYKSIIKMNIKMIIKINYKND